MPPPRRHLLPAQPPWLCALPVCQIHENKGAAELGGEQPWRLNRFALLVARQRLQTLRSLLDVHVLKPTLSQQRATSAGGRSRENRRLTLEPRDPNLDPSPGLDAAFVDPAVTEL